MSLREFGPGWLRRWSGELQSMMPKIRDRPLLYFGDVSHVRTELRGTAQFGDVGPLPLWKTALVTFWLPAIIAHELTHYITARLVGIPVPGVVLFQYSNLYVGANIVPEEAMTPGLAREAFLAAPLFVCGPLALHTLKWTAAASGLSQTLLGLLIASGFIWTAIPDQLRDDLFRRHAEA